MPGGGAPGTARRRSLRTRSSAEQWRGMFANAGRNLEQGRIALIQALARKA